ncbi:MAG: endonuclease/exonuclease/phosphatase family protein [Planctomycetes bacterium]|nr:endonuclease/exonuclease/phosphatase family protein [Planctomycetota bacterium]
MFHFTTKKKYLLISAVGFLMITSGVIMRLPFWISGPRTKRLKIHKTSSFPSARNLDNPAESILSVMTLNTAHGAGNSFTPLFKRTRTVRDNIDRIANVIRERRPQFVALQETDGPSFWSGNFDHVAMLAEKSGFQRHVRAEQVSGLGLQYGTACISNLPVRDAISHTFSPAPPVFCKGCTIATVSWPNHPDRTIDVVSVHLDCIRASVRRSQARELVDLLAQQERPLVVTGDFNCGWDEENSALRLLTEALELKAYRAEKEGLGTFPASGKRLDWILLSPELIFQSYTVLPDRISDHKAVLCQIKWAG